MKPSSRILKTISRSKAVVISVLALTCLNLVLAGFLEPAANAKISTSTPDHPLVSQANAASLDFTSAGNYSTGTSPFTVVMDDFNGDGKTDLAVANEGSGTVSVLLGNDNGTFQAAINSPAGSNPYSIVAKDFNGDGKLDLGVGNRHITTLSVLLGNGDGTFQAPTSYTVGLDPCYVVVGDFNGDGKLDLIAANEANTYLSVLLGKGDGTFLAGSNIGTNTTNPVFIAVDDYNKDGKLDLAVTFDPLSAPTSVISIYLGNGNATFQTPVNYGVGPRPFSLASADFNGDGKLDLAASNSAWQMQGVSSSVSILLGKGDGTFQTAVNYPAGMGRMTSGDIDRDGKIDLIVDDPNSLGINVLLNNGNGTFQAPLKFSTGNASSFVTVGDVNKDGSLDIVASNQSAANVTVLLNIPCGGTFTSANNYTTGTNPYASVIGDFNNDNKLDIAVANEGSGTVSILPGKGDGTFQAAINSQAGTSPFSLVAKDFNGDGKLDLAVTNHHTSNLKILLGNGNGTFQAPVNYFVGSDAIHVAAKDLNGDGKVDLVVAGEAGNTLTILLGNGDGTFQYGTLVVLNVKNPVYTTIADFNGDGKFDLAVTFDTISITSTVSIFLGNGDGTFQSPVNYTVGSRPFAVVTDDLNGDGKLDLVTSNSAWQLSGANSGVSILFGNGDGTFQAAVNYTVNATGGRMTTGDVNGDNKPDLIIAGGTSNSVGVMLNNGNGTFQALLSYAVGNTPSYVAAGDLNGDGTLDMVASNYGANNVSVLVNLAAIPCLFLTAPASTTQDSPITVTATVIPRNSSAPAANYRGTLHFTSSDNLAILPIDYAFVAADSGVHSFSVTLRTTGTQTITATDTSSSFITNSAIVSVANCGVLEVNSNLDNGTCGTLRNAIDFLTANPANPTKTITFNLTPQNSAISLKNTGLVVPASVTITSTCNNNLPAITIDGTGIAGDGLVLSGKNTISGLKVTHFKGKQIKLRGNKNQLNCVQALK